MNALPESRSSSTNARVPMPAPQLPSPWPALPIYTLPPLAQAVKAPGGAVTPTSPTLPTALAFGG